MNSTQLQTLVRDLCNHIVGWIRWFASLAITVIVGLMVIRMVCQLAGLPFPAMIHLPNADQGTAILLAAFAFALRG